MQITQFRGIHGLYKNAVLSKKRTLEVLRLNKIQCIDFKVHRLIYNKDRRNVYRGMLLNKKFVADRLSKRY